VPVLLDSTVLIDVLRGRPAARRLLALRERGEVPYLCAANTLEVHRGLRPDEVGRATAVLAAFQVAPLGAMEGALAGVWQREFRARGITLHEGDCLIAAAAVGVHATIVTGNPKDFPMEGVTVEHWPVGA
jgi:predicted nucleic acid-binding protein